jgi:lipopolysaccharide export system permease protein
MPVIERYIFRRTLHVFLLTLGALIATLWITQVLKQLDVVTAKGQAISVFLLMTLFALPALVQVVAPIAYLVATIVTLNSLGSDGELPVIPAAGGLPRAINRPIILLGVIVMIATAISHHFLAPASRADFRILLTRMRADVIATLIRPGGFRAVDEGLVMNFRSKEPDGSFRDVFVNDERNPKETMTFTAARGFLLEKGNGAYLVLQDGNIIRSDHVQGESDVASFQTYALDLSQLGTPNAAPVYEAMERSTVFLLEPSADDSYSNRFPHRIRAEIHDRTTAPLFTLAFGLIALAFLGQPYSSRQNRGGAVALVVTLCILLRALGFAATAVGRNLGGAIPFMYAVPLIGIAFGIYAITRTERPQIPPFLLAMADKLAALARRNLGTASAVGGGAP